MTTYNTDNPIGSPAPKDLYDNAENLDTATNSLSDEVWVDRFGVDRKTWHGMEADFDAAQASRESEFDADQASRESEFNKFINSSGYVGTGSGGAFEDYDTDGPLTITSYNQIFAKDGELYRAKGGTALPYTTSGTWATDEVDFVSVGDAALRQELASDGGAFLVKGAVAYVDTIADLLALTDQVDGQEVSVTSFHAVWSGSTDNNPAGGGEFVWSDSMDKTEHNGFTIISPTVPWDGLDANLLDFLEGTGETEPSGAGCWVRKWEGEVNVTWAGAKRSPAPGQNSGAMNIAPVIQHIIDYFAIDNPFLSNSVSRAIRPVSILIPAGEWNWSDTVRLGGDGNQDYLAYITIRGEGRGATTCRSYNNANKSLSVNNDKQNIRNVTVKDMRFIWGAGFDLNDVQYCLFQSLTLSQIRGPLSGGSDFAIVANGSPGFAGTTIFRDCWIVELTSDVSVAIGSASLTFDGCLFGENSGGFRHISTGVTSLRNCNIFGSRSKTFTVAGPDSDGTTDTCLFYASGGLSMMRVQDCTIDADTTGSPPGVIFGGAGNHQFVVDGLHLRIPARDITLFRDGNAQSGGYPSHSFKNITVDGVGPFTLVDNYNSSSGAQRVRRTRNSTFSNLSIPEGTLCEDEMFDPGNNNTFEAIHFLSNGG